MSGASELLTAEEVAPIVRLHKVTVYRKARAGEIESVRIGRKRLFRRSAIDAYLASCTVSAAPPAPEPQPAAADRPRRNPNRTYKT
ncbi:helix-turn-helix domain-containing protein [Actinocrinis puniceicyclus]|uniref:Helix-turn-helix domain-containing protein n=1 Tax=Actinocrinis puniceicyclus TaxID=977794 RepID=A0A8J7WMU3_9ACTN|nr:helix-turn-helix domain-containing protein [Actinocrinis puniceicyclus]MBS2962627.1 helix-turn-helix domain-containing protein [Actinocrinis puniceicyclus]